MGNPGLWPPFPDGQQIQGTQEIFRKYLLPPPPKASAKVLGQIPQRTLRAQLPASQHSHQIPNLICCLLAFKTIKGCTCLAEQFLLQGTEGEKRAQQGLEIALSPSWGEDWAGRPANRSKTSKTEREAS